MPHASHVCKAVRARQPLPRLQYVGVGQISITTTTYVSFPWGCCWYLNKHASSSNIPKTDGRLSVFISVSITMSRCQLQVSFVPRSASLRRADVPTLMLPGLNPDLDSNGHQLRAPHTAGPLPTRCRGAPGRPKFPVRPGPLVINIFAVLLLKKATQKPSLER